MLGLAPRSREHRRESAASPASVAAQDSPFGQQNGLMMRPASHRFGLISRKLRLSVGRVVGLRREIAQVQQRHGFQRMRKFTYGALSELTGTELTTAKVPITFGHASSNGAQNNMSLRKVSNWRVESFGFWRTRWRIYFTKTQYFELPNEAFQRAKKRVESSAICRIGSDGDRALWWTSDGLFWADSALSHEDVELLAWDRQRRQESRISRLRKIRIRENDLVKTRRERIPEEVRAFVWRRDEERCVQCGSQDELQFDHIIPVARGGSSTIENIQILCGECNRQKSDSI